VAGHVVTKSYLLLLTLMLPFLAGCPANLNRVPGPTELKKEPRTGGEYYLYVPSWHTSEKRWPLVVTCHGTEPFDTAQLQIQEWRGLAERVGFIVAAPRLVASNGMRVGQPAEQIAGQQADEELILNVVRRTIGTLNIDPDCVYLVGWSGGGYTVMWTGLRNPQVFRAVVSRMGTFNAEYMPGVAHRYDPYQPVGIFFGEHDPIININKQCRESYKWLVDHGGKRVTLREITGGHQRQPDVAFDFFKTSTEKYAMVRPSAVTKVGGEALAVQFYVKVSPEAKAYIWEFGDGAMSAEQNPRHVYGAPGDYLAKVTVITAQGTRTDRTLKIGLTK